MGGSHSSRKLSVDNDNSIQVSQEALERIQSQLTAKQAEQPPPPPQYSAPPPVYPTQKQHQQFAAEEAYWARRIQDLQRSHEKINAGMMNDYQKTLKEANDLFSLVQGDNVATKLPPCQDEKSKVLQCYSTNPGKSLVCSVLVNQFNDCVCKSRVAAVTATS